MTPYAEDEVLRAIASLGPSCSVVPLPASIAGPLFIEISNRFVGKAGASWWWEQFSDAFPSKDWPSPGISVIDKAFSAIVEKVYLVASNEDDSNWPIFVGSPKSVVAVLDKCFPFEFYILPVDLSWLVCETHHDMLYAVGERAIDRLSVALD